MPADWVRHARTWMAYPGDVLVRESGAAHAWIEVAAAMVDDEPVTMLVPPGLIEEAKRLVDRRVDLLACELDSCWLRDSGPTFVASRATPADGPLSVTLDAVCWTFNGWGGFDGRDWHRDAGVGSFVAAAAASAPVPSALVNEGGALISNGMGTVITTESVMLDPRRNPGWTKHQVEAELRRTLGATAIIWLPRGLTGDMTSLVGGNGTNGHIDVFCAWTRPNRVVLHHQPDPDHPDHDVMAQAHDALSSVRLPDGRPVEIVRLRAPVPRGDNCHDSYVNFALTNHSVVVGTFGDPAADALAMSTLSAEFPGRRIRTVDARPIFDNGGGIHCITQHQPATPGV